MENLTLNEHPPPGLQQQGVPPMPPGGGRMAPPPQQPPMPAQLPPQMFTTAAQLLDLTDKKLLLCLRDGRKLTGILRSWDQFANLVLQATIERIYAPLPGGAAEPSSPTRGYYADKSHGLFLVRGENVLLLGEIDLDKDDEPPAGFAPAELDVVEKLAKETRAADKVKGDKKLKKLATLGFEGEHQGEILL